MHELSLCRSMLDIIHAHIKGKQATQVTVVRLELGELAAVDAAALRFGFEAITQGTIAEKAQLEISVIEGQALCDHCHNTVTIKHYYDACQICGHFSLVITQGEALRITCLEII